MIWNSNYNSAGRVDKSVPSGEYRDLFGSFRDSRYDVGGPRGWYILWLSVEYNKKNKRFEAESSQHMGERYDGKAPDLMTAIMRSAGMRSQLFAAGLDLYNTKIFAISMREWGALVFYDEKQEYAMFFSEAIFSPDTYINSNPPDNYEATQHKYTYKATPYTLYPTWKVAQWIDTVNRVEYSDFYEPFWPSYIDTPEGFAEIKGWYEGLKEASDLNIKDFERRVGTMPTKPSNFNK